MQVTIIKIEIINEIELIKAVTLIPNYLFWETTFVIRKKIYQLIQISSD
jgi:hypothetical protein